MSFEGYLQQESILFALNSLVSQSACTFQVSYVSMSVSCLALAVVKGCYTQMLHM